MATINHKFDHYTKCGSYIREDGSRIRQGGVSILWSKDMAVSVKPIDINDNNIQGVQVNTHEGSSCIILNAYLPSANHGFDLFSDSISTLSDVCQYYTSFNRVIICGDFNSNVIHGPRALVNANADPRRNILINDFMSKTNLFSIVTCDICRGTRETFMPYDGSRGTQIDHILIDNSERINNIHMAIVHDDDALNSSDHKPLSLHIKAYIPTYLFQSRSLYRWDRADKTKYADLLDQYIIIFPRNVSFRGYYVFDSNAAAAAAAAVRRRRRIIASFRC